MKNKKLFRLSLVTLLALTPMTTYALTKNEMVYSNLDYDGSISKTVVTNHLSDMTGNTVSDDTELQNILNINGKETFTLENNNLTWNNLDQDIYYQGSTDKELPVQVKIQYYLNDQEKTVSDMLGNSGHVKIVFTLTNTESNSVLVNGSYQTMYTPFITMVGTMLDSEKNSNVSITNGKVVGTGSKNMVVGIASPGLYESTNIDELKDFNSITLTYDTTCFELQNIYLVSSPKLLENTDFSIFDKMDTIYSNIQTLSNSMDQIESSMKELSDGASTLASGSNSLMNGIKDAENGVSDLQTGATKIDGGLKQILAKLASSKTELEASSKELTSSIQDLTTLKSKNTATITSILTKAGMTAETMGTIYQQNNLVSYEGTDATLLSVKQNYELIMLLTANNNAIDKSIQALQNMASKLNTLITTLSSAISDVDNGVGELESGLTKLKTGMDKLYSGSVTLTNGANTLASGASALSAGTTTFNNDGIKKIVSVANSAKNYTSKLEALTNLSNNYNGYTSDNAKSTVFIEMVKRAKTNCKDANDTEE